MKLDEVLESMCGKVVADAIVDKVESDMKLTVVFTDGSEVCFESYGGRYLASEEYFSGIDVATGGES